MNKKTFPYIAIAYHLDEEKHQDVSDGYVGECFLVHIV